MSGPVPPVTYPYFPGAFGLDSVDRALSINELQAIMNASHDAQWQTGPLGAAVENFFAVNIPDGYLCIVTHACVLYENLAAGPGTAYAGLMALDRTGTEHALERGISTETVAGGDMFACCSLTRPIVLHSGENIGYRCMGTPTWACLRYILVDTTLPARGVL